MQSTLSEFDLYLLAEGTHYRAYEKLGAHLAEKDGKRGVQFAVWAPNAKRVSVIGDFNDWNPHARSHAPVDRRNLGRFRSRTRRRRDLQISHRIAAITTTRSTKPIPTASRRKFARRRRRASGISKAIRGMTNPGWQAAHKQQFSRLSAISSTKCISAHGDAHPRKAIAGSPIAKWRRSSPITSMTPVSRMSNCFPSWSIPSTVPGVTRPPATSLPPAGSELPPTSCTWSTIFTSGESA